MAIHECLANSISVYTEMKEINKPRKEKKSDAYEMDTRDIRDGS